MITRSTNSILAAAVFILFALAGALPAQQQWIAVEKICPIDGTKCQLLEPTGPPPPVKRQASRLEVLDESFAAPNAWYQCMKCGFACHMRDFRPMDKERSQKVLVLLVSAPKPDTEKSYNMTVFSDRLEAAEKTLPALGKGKDPAYMADFYRLTGYAYALEGKRDKAKAAREQALLISGELAKDNSRAGLLRETITIMAALNHDLGEDAKARTLLDKAEGLRYKNPLLRDQQNEQKNTDLAAIILELRETIDNADNKTVPKPPESLN